MKIGVEPGDLATNFENRLPGRRCDWKGLYSQCYGNKLRIRYPRVYVYPDTLSRARKYLILNWNPDYASQISTLTSEVVEHKENALAVSNPFGPLVSTVISHAISTLFASLGV